MSSDLQGTLPTVEAGARYPAPPPGRHREGSPRVLLVLVGAILVGCLVAYAAMPAVFRRTPSDLSRTRVILSTLDRAAPRPEVVVLGSSIAMNGIDARKLSEELPGHPLAYNLASPAQSLGEALLLYQELPSSVKTVIHVVHPGALELEPGAQVFLGGPGYEPAQEDTNRCISPTVYNAYYMYGYRPTTETSRLLGEACGRPMTKLLGASRLEQTFNSRWVLHQALDTWVRKAFRKDIGFDQVTNDLYFPSYVPKVTAEQKELVFRRYQAQRTQGLSLLGEDVELLRFLAVLNERAGRRMLLVFTPLHPRMQGFFGQRFLDDVSRFSTRYDVGSHVETLDASTLLGDVDFVDDVHASPHGAALLTSAVAAHLTSH